MWLCSMYIDGGTLEVESTLICLAICVATTLDQRSSSSPTTPEVVLSDFLPHIVLSMHYIHMYIILLKVPVGRSLLPGRPPCCIQELIQRLWVENKAGMIMIQGQG